MVAGLAEAKTSAGAPLVDLGASSELAAKLNVTCVPGWSASNVLPERRERLGQRRGRQHRRRSPVTSPPTTVAGSTRRSSSAPALTHRTPASGEHGQERADGQRRTGASDGHQRALRDLDDDVGGLHRGDGQDARLEPELVGGLPAHQRHDPERPGLDLDLGHHRVPGDPGDDAAQPVAGRLRDHRARVGAVGQPLRRRRQDLPLDPCRPDGAVVVSSRPASAQRRTVSSLTPSRSAASRDPEDASCRGILTAASAAGNSAAICRICGGAAVGRTGAADAADYDRGRRPTDEGVPTTDDRDAGPDRTQDSPTRWRPRSRRRTATSPSSWCGSPRRPRWPPAAGSAAATRTAPTAPRSTRCASSSTP